MNTLEEIITEIKECNIFEGEIKLGEVYTFKEGGYIAHCYLKNVEWDAENKSFKVTLDIFKDSYDSKFNKPFVLSFSPDIKNFYYSGRISIMSGITYCLDRVEANYKDL